MRDDDDDADDSKFAADPIKGFQLRTLKIGETTGRYVVEGDRVYYQPLLEPGRKKHQAHEGQPQGHRETTFNTELKRGIEE